MELKRVVTGLAFAALGSLAFLAACDPPGSGCTFDSDCFEDEICFNNTCRQTCTTNNDCLIGETCEPGRGDTNVCLPEGADGDTCAFDGDCELGEVCFGNVCTPTCTDSGDCNLGFACETRPGSTSDARVCQADGGETPECTVNEDCNIEAGELCLNGSCFLPGIEFYTVRIVDTTQGDRCDDRTYGFDTGGAKLMYVALLDDDGQVLHYADAIEFLPGTPAPFFGDAFDIINGQPPAFDGQCPNQETFNRNNSTQTVTSNFHEDSVFAMGCGGELFAQFRDSEGNLVVIDESHSIEVNAYGLACAEGQPGPPQSQEDPYDLEICSDRSSTNTDIETCVRQNSAPLQGRTFTSVRFE